MVNIRIYNEASRSLERTVTAINLSQELPFVALGEGAKPGDN